MRGDQYPELQDKVLYRNRETIQVFDRFDVINTTEQKSADVECGPYRHFGLFLFIDSTGTPTTLQVKVQFLDRWTGRWYTYKQGPFASLFWEDGDTASGIAECFRDQCLGRAIRITLTGVGTSGSAYFTVSAALEFWN